MRDVQDPDLESGVVEQPHQWQSLGLAALGR